MSIGKHFQVSRREDLEAQGIQPYCSIHCGQPSLTDASLSFQQVSMYHRSLEAHGLLRVHRCAIIRQSSLH